MALGLFLTLAAFLGQFPAGFKSLSALRSPFRWCRAGLTAGIPSATPGTFRPSPCLSFPTYNTAQDLQMAKQSSAEQSSELSITGWRNPWLDRLSRKGGYLNTGKKKTMECEKVRPQFTREIGSILIAVLTVVLVAALFGPLCVPQPHF